jgi:ribosome-associated heat shock protein Hsp15
MRLDQWLWAVRLFKTRNLAAEAIKGGHVKVNGAATKPAHEMKPGELVTARSGIMTRTLRVLDAPPSRVGAKLVAQFAEDLTPPEEWEKQRVFNLRSIGARPKGTGRPTKRERRLLDELAENDLPFEEPP